MDVLTIKNLKVIFDDTSGLLTAVHDVNFTLKKGEILGIIGESGSGKSVTAKSILRLINVGKKGKLSGEILFNGKNILEITEKEMCQIRGKEISMIFQEPMTALNPVMTVGKQLEELYKLHGLDNVFEIEELLIKMGINNPKQLMSKYPFELSGGLRQRVVIAMAVLLRPQIIIADEPTTALDVTTQAQILLLLKNIAREIGCSVLVITHDFGVIAEIADRVAVMYRGIVVETCAVEDFFDNPVHPYSKGLIASRPSNFNGRFFAIRGNVEQNYGEYIGCPYINRCEKVCDICKKVIPQADIVGKEHFVCCHNSGEK